MIKSSWRRHSFSAFAGSVVFYFPLVFFLLLVLLSFFTYPAAEDLTINYWDHAVGLRANITSFYLDSSSRYFSFPILFYILDGGFAMEHYYVVALGLWLGLWGGLFLFLRALARRVLNEGIGARWYVWLAAVLPLAICSILFQPASIFYWVSGSVTYLLGFVLFIFLMIVLLRAGGRGWATKGEMVAGVLLAIATVGSNEITMYYEVVILVWLQLIYYSATGKMLRLVNVLLVVVLACVIFFILPGGASRRAGHFRVNWSFWQAVIIAGTYTCRDYLQLIVSPMVWLCLLLAGAAGALTREGVRSRLADSYWFRPWVCLLPALPGVGCFYLLIYLFSGEVLPPRANGLLQFFIFFFLLTAAYAYGVRHPEEPGLLRRLCDGWLVRLLVILVFVGSPLFYRAVADLGTGWIYRKVIEKRERDISRVKDRRKVVLQPYEDDYETVAPAIMPPSVRNRLIRKAPRYPFLMYYMDPLADTGLITYYAQYYGIDTISYLGRNHPRIGLVETTLPTP